MSNKFDVKEAWEMFNGNVTDTVKKYCEKIDIPYEVRYRHRLSKYKKKMKKFLQKNKSSDNKDDNSLMPSAWCGTKGIFLDIEEYCDKYGLDISKVKKSKLVSHNSGHMVYNIEFFTEEEEVLSTLEDSLEDIVKKFIEPSNIQVNYKLSVDTKLKNTFDRVVYTDVHIGMDVNGNNGSPIYKGKWDKEELIRRLDIMAEDILFYRSSKELYLDDLGDFLDGLSKMTTREGHKLPQNMTDEEVYELGIFFKTRLVDRLVGYFDKIVCNNVLNDNHSGKFAHFVNSAAKKILEMKYPSKVKVNNINRFMEHYSVGKHTFILCHGKDREHMKFSFKPFLDTKQIEKIDAFCKEELLYNGNYIEFSKGDSHQAVFDETSTLDFDYYSYPAFSPPSDWVKTNFKNTKSGFRIFNISKDSNVKIHIPRYFSK